MNSQSLSALFAEHASPTHASKRHVHDQLKPVLQMVALIQKQLIEYKTLLSDEQFSQADGSLDGKFEHVHQTFAAIERNANAVMFSLRELGKDMTQLDRYIADTKADIERATTVVPITTEADSGAQAAE